MKASAKLNFLQDHQLLLEESLLKTIIKAIPYNQLPKVALFVDEFTKPLSLNIRNDNIFRDVMLILFRFRDNLKIIKQFNPIQMRDKNLLELEIDDINENKLPIYLDLIEQEIRSRRLRDSKKPKLIITKKIGSFDIKFIPLIGNVRSDNFKKDKNETNILFFLIENNGIPFETSALIFKLKDTRMGAQGSDPKRRVLNAIKAIKDKLGQSVISSEHGRHKVDCEISYP